MPDALPDDIQRLLDERADYLGPFARSPRFLASTGSTNDDAARLAAAGAHEGTWVLAEAQSAGRGRRGRVWASPPGAGLYLSVVFRPQPSPGRSTSAAAAGPASPATSLLTLMAGVAVASGIQAATGLIPALKWPNDVMIEMSGGAPATSRWRKLAGILAEASAIGGSLQSVVLGIGLNLTPAAYPPDVQARATSLEGELGRPIERALVLVELLAALADGRRQLLAGGEAALLARWRALAPSSIGRRVRWTANGTPRTGLTRGVDDEGALLVQAGERVERIIAGEVEWE